MSSPNEFILGDIIKFCQIDFHKFDPERAIVVIEALNSLLSKIKIELTRGYVLSLKQLKECLKFFSPDLRGIDCIVFMYDIRREKCIKAFKMQRPCDLVETFAELYLDRSDVKNREKIDEIISDIKKSLWKEADKLEEEIIYLERLRGIESELGILIRGAIEDLTMQLDQIDERITELDALLELFHSKLRETDKYLIVEQEGLKGLVFMDKYILIIINVEKLERIIRCQIDVDDIFEINEMLKDLSGADRV